MSGAFGERINGKSVRALARGFNAFVADKGELQHFPTMEYDAARERLDNAVADTLGIPKEAFANLRARLAREPIISNRPYSTEQNGKGKGQLSSKSTQKSRK